MPRYKFNELPDHVREKVLLQIRASSDTPVRAKRDIGSKPNKTEEAFNRLILNGTGAYEAVTFRLPGGSRYTPDFFTVEDGMATFYEVKGSYRLHSHGRALTAFKECRAQFPMFRFEWWEKQKSGEWKQKYENSERKD